MGRRSLAAPSAAKNLAARWTITAASSALDPVIRARVAATWAGRTRAEIEATARFTRMAEELAQTGAHPVVVQGARDAALDEARHRDICASVAAEWGDTSALSHVPPRERIGRSTMEPRDRLLWEVVAVCCLGETMNTALMTRCFELCKDESIRAALHELLKDEVRHARLGWGHLAAERAAGRGAFLGDVLPMILEASVEPGFLEGTMTMPWSPALHDYGELPLTELVQLYRETLDEVVFKGLESMGVDATKGRAWLAARVT